MTSKQYSLYSINAHLNCRFSSVTDTNLALSPQHNARMRQHMLRNNTATKATNTTLVTRRSTLQQTVKSYKLQIRFNTICTITR